MAFENTCNLLKERFGADSFTTSEFRDNRRIHVAAGRLFEMLKCLKEDAGFDYLAELCAADYLNYPNARDRYGVIYGLTNTVTGERLFVKTFVNDPDPVLPSCFPIWKAADWLEREVFDMYGIVFEGHPQLKRIYLYEEFQGHPLRKDYPKERRQPLIGPGSPHPSALRPRPPTNEE